MIIAYEAPPSSKRKLTMVRTRSAVARGKGSIDAPTSSSSEEEFDDDVYAVERICGKRKRNGGVQYLAKCPYGWRILACVLCIKRKIGKAALTPLC